MRSDVIPFSSEAHVATSPCHMTRRQTDVRQKGSGLPAPGQTFVCSLLLMAEPLDVPQAPASMSVHVSSHCLRYTNTFFSIQFGLIRTVYYLSKQCTETNRYILIIIIGFFLFLSLSLKWNRSDAVRLQCNDVSFVL